MMNGGRGGSDRGTFREILTAAVADITEHGYDSVERVAGWQAKLIKAADAMAMPQWRVDELLRSSFGAIYKKLIEMGGILRHHPDVPKFTLNRLAPRLRGELNRRIAMSAELIKLNKADAMAKTMRRFSGWASSVPAGGSNVVDRSETKADIGKAFQSLGYVERRVAIDQSNKFRSALSEIIAQDSGAIAVIWHSHWKQSGYNYRVDHKERDKHVYAVRNNWAIENGLMRRGDNPYYDEITAFGEEVCCRCYGQWLTGLRALPDDMLTDKGRAALAEAKSRAA